MEIACAKRSRFVAFKLDEIVRSYDEFGGQNAAKSLGLFSHLSLYIRYLI